MIGLHIIADFLDIPSKNLNVSQEKIQKKISESIAKSGLKELGSYYHTFENKNEITGIIALAESHVSFHIWPEKKYMSLDIFVCNLGSDNSLKAEEVFESFLTDLQPKNYEVQKIKRYSQKRP